MLYYEKNEYNKNTLKNSYEILSVFLWRGRKNALSVILYLNYFKQIEKLLFYMQ